jgi:hypothetical protein
VFDVEEAAWSNNWAWGLPLIVLTVLVHALALVEIRGRIVLELPIVLRPRRCSMVLAVLMVVSVLLLTALHGGGVRVAGAYVALGARPDFRFRHALFARRDDKLRPHRPVPGATLAIDGHHRGAERHDAIRPVDCVPVRRASRTLAEETAPIEGAHKFTRRNDFNRLVSLRCAAEENANENKGLRFAMRNETFRGEGSKSLKSLIVLNRRFRVIACFQ